MYNPLTDEEIKNNIRSMFSYIENKSVVELAINSLFNFNISSFGELTTQEVDVIRERFGINDIRTPKTLKEIGEKYNVTGERIRAIEAKAKRSLLRRIVHFRDFFKFYKLKIPNNIKEFLFSSNICSYKDFNNFFNKNLDTNETQEFRETLNVFKKSLPKELNMHILDCGFSQHTNQLLCMYEINYVAELILLFKDERRYIHYRNRNRDIWEEVENYLDSLNIIDINKLNTIKEKSILENPVKTEDLSIEDTMEKQQEEIIDTEITLKTEHNNIVDIQTEDLSIEDVVEKQLDENSIIRKRIEKKEELLKKYKKVSDEKAQLLEKEKELDDELKIIMEKIKGSYMENKNDRTKK